MKKSLKFWKRTFAGLLAITLIMAGIYVSEKVTNVLATDVSKDMLNVKVQTATDDTNVIRFISSVDCLDYNMAGFEVTPAGENKKIYETQMVYERIASTTDGVEYEFSPKVVDTKSEYFVTAKLNATAGVNYTVRAFVKTMDGTYVYGASRCVSVEDGYADTPLNVSFASKTEVAKGTELSVVYGSDSTATKATVIGCDGETVHVRVDVDKETLPSATKFTFSGAAEGSTIYRNLYTEYDGVADRTWYKVYRAEGVKEFYIATNADLYGFAEEYVKNGNTFSGEKIYVVSDLVGNKGDAKDWRQSAPDYAWTPIGNHTYQFAGEFDGQGHTIRGLYFKRNTEYSGLFGYTGGGSYVKNFRLENCYFECNNGGYAIMGGIIGRAGGSVSDIYCDIMIVSNAQIVGGIVAQTWETDLEVTNCQFGGEISMEGAAGWCAGGMIGDVRAAEIGVKHCLFDGKISIEAPSNRTGLPHAGGIVGRCSGGNLTIRDSLVSGTMLNPNKANCVGSVIGRCMNAASVKNQNVYATTECYATVSYADTASNITGTVGQSAADLYGLKARENTLLDFENYWVSVEAETPILKAFYEGNGIDTDVIIKSDTSWYNTNENAVFWIENRDQFYGFRDLVNSGKTFATQTVKLRKDIVLNSKDGDATSWRSDAPTNTWTPIGNWNNQFAGIFDGQGHTISGIYMKTATAYNGLFGVINEGSVLKNFRLENSYFENTSGGDAAIMGAVVARTRGNILNVYTNAILVSNARIVGGFVGQVWDKPVSITNCQFDGTIYMEGANGWTAGGFVGEQRAANTTIEHCLYSGTLSVESPANRTGLPHVGGFVGLVNTQQMTIRDSLSAGKIINNSNANLVGAINGRCKSSMVFENVYATTECYKIANWISDAATTASGVTLVAKATISGTNGYANTMLDFNQYWVASEQETPVLKSFYQGKSADVSDILRADTDWYDTTANKTFVLTTKEQFLGFQQLSVSGITFETQTIELGTDIILNSNDGSASTWGEEAPANSWGGIGNWNSQFKGTFDGKGHTIKGLYMVKADSYLGLFCVTGTGSVVKNVKVMNSYFENTGATAMMGSVVGRALGDVHTVYSDAILVSTGNIVGGIVGHTWTQSINITNCWFDGSITMKGQNGVWAGGILGEVRAANTTATLTACLNTGEMEASETTTQWQSVGGFVGYVNQANAKLVLKDCLNTATIVNKNEKVGSVASTIGMAGINNVATIIEISNTYVADDNARKIDGFTAVQYVKKEILTFIAEMEGTVATLNQNGDYWAAVPNGTPILKSFQ